MIIEMHASSYNLKHIKVPHIIQHDIYIFLCNFYVIHNEYADDR